MDVDFYDVFASEGAVPGVDESESDIFDASGMFCAELQSSETSLSLRSSTSSSEASTTTSSSEVPATAVGLVASAESASSDPGMLVRQFGKQKDAAASVPQMVETTGDGGFSNDSNGSSVITTVEGGIFMKPARTDVTGEIIDLDGTRSGQNSHKNRSIASSCRWGSIADEPSFFQLDDLLQLDSREPLVDSVVPLVDNFFTSSLGQPSASMGDWPAELLPDFSCSLGASQPMPEVYEEPMENVSQVFTRWLQSNSHRFSLSDISKIKLKTSTIENGMKRLGGGKKGTLYFLKLVLSWIQDQHGSRRRTEITGSAGLDNSTGMDEGRISAKVEDGSINGSSCVLAAVSAAGGNERVQEDLYCSAFRRKDERFGGLSQCTDLSEPAATQPQHGGTYVVDAGGPVYNNYYSHSTAPSQLLNEGNCGCSRTINDGGEKPLFSASNGAPRSLSPSSSSLVTNVGNCESQWHDNTAVGPPWQERAYPQPRVISSSSERYSSFSNSLDLKSPNTSAATTRAARMSRMERRKWSAQRQRKWPEMAAAKISWSSQSVTRARPVL